MAIVSLPYTLTAGQPENVGNLNSNLTALLTGVNNIDATNITDGSIGVAELATAVTDLLAPVGALMDYSGSSDPVAGKWILADGRAISRSTYATLFGVLSTTYGVGDNSTTFNIPDFRGRAAVGPDNMGTAQGAASRMADNNTRGAASGSSTRTLALGNIPAHDHSFSGTTVSDGSHTHTASTASAGSHTHAFTNAGLDPIYTTFPGASSVTVQGSGGITLYRDDLAMASAGAHTHTVTVNSGGSHTHTFSGTTGQTGSATAFDNRQPYQVVNKIIRIA